MIESKQDFEIHS